MKEDKLLRDLAQLADEQSRRDAERFDRRWDDLAAGRLSPEQGAALRAEAEGSPDLELAWEGFQPLAPELRAAIVRDAASRLEAGKQPAAPARVLPFPGRLSRKTLLSGLAVAASLILAVSIWRFPGTREPLPAYQLIPGGGLRNERSGAGSAAEILRLAPGVRFEVVLRPERAAENEPAVKIFKFRNGNIEPLPLDKKLIEIAPGGTVRISAVLGEDFDLEPGEQTLVFVVGRGGSLPAAEKLLATKPHSDWQLLEQRVEVIAPDR